MLVFSHKPQHLDSGHIKAYTYSIGNGYHHLCDEVFFKIRYFLNGMLLKPCYALFLPRGRCNGIELVKSSAV